MKNANPVSVLLALSLFIAAGVGCSRKGEDAQPAFVPVHKTVQDWFNIKVGARTVRMQIAVLDIEQQRGLMQRRDLGKDDGMLFVDRAPQAMVFWMKDTPTPLDIAYFTPEGALAEVHVGLPFDERNLNSVSQNLQFVLEMHQGWYSANNVRTGDKLDLGAVAAALRERGFDPKDFGLNE